MKALGTGQHYLSTARVDDFPVSRSEHCHNSKRAAEIVYEECDSCDWFVSLGSVFENTAEFELGQITETSDYISTPTVI